MRLPDLKPQFQSYIAQLKKSLFVIYAKYEVKNRIELAVKVREGTVDTKDSDKAIELLKVINECGRNNVIVYSEIDKARFLELKKQIMEREEHKLEVFFKRRYRFLRCRRKLRSKIWNNGGAGGWSCIIFRL